MHQEEHESSVPMGAPDPGASAVRLLLTEGAAEDRGIRQSHAVRLARGRVGAGCGAQGSGGCEQQRGRSPCRRARRSCRTDGNAAHTKK